LDVGSRLDEVLGHDLAMDFLRYVLRTCSRGMQDKRPVGLILDELRVELLSHLNSAQDSLLDLAAEHAALAIEIACGVRDCLLEPNGAPARDAAELLARRAKHWEREADELLIRVRDRVARAGRGDFFRNLIELADDVADELEDAAFHLTLTGEGTGEGGVGPPELGILASLLVESTQEYLKAIETARGLHRSAAREDMQDFLEAIHRMVELEQQSDAAQRAVKRALVGTADHRQLFVLAECARNLEAAADALMHVGLTLRDYVLGEAVAR
jgi:uncharacterized protein Yka (UPF0111/DUF47 family)